MHHSAGVEVRVEWSQFSPFIFQITRFQGSNPDHQDCVGSAITPELSHWL